MNDLFEAVQKLNAAIKAAHRVGLDEALSFVNEPNSDNAAGAEAFRLYRQRMKWLREALDDFEKADTGV